MKTFKEFLVETIEFPRIDRFHDLSLRRASANVKTSAESAFSGHPFQILAGVREVPASRFSLQGEHLFDTPEKRDRVQKLADQIKRSQAIEPLFVAQKPGGSFYLAEGAHRARALKLLGYTSVPAKVILGLRLYPGETKEWYQL
jgi:hypothetical protein